MIYAVAALVLLCAALIVFLVLRKPRIVVATEREIAEAEAHVERFAAALAQAVHPARKADLKRNLDRWRAIASAEK